MNIILFGAPGVGKGTQAAILAERLGIPHISTGAIFREAISSGSPIGKELKNYLDNGILVPDEITTAVALEAVAASRQGFILDGFPRNRSQAEALYAALKEANRAIDHIIYLTAPLDELTERMVKRGRTDDTPETIRTRFEVYENDTAPVLNFLREIDNVVEINGVGEIDEVQERILAKVNQEVGE